MGSREMTTPTHLVVIDSHTKPGHWLLTKYVGKKVAGKAELPCTQHTAAELMVEVEAWRKAE